MSSKKKVPIDALSRRDILRGVALALTSGGFASLDPLAAEQVHETATRERAQTGSYEPKLFNTHEFATVTRLAELLIPADEVSGSAVDAGAPEFIDLLCSENGDLADIFTGGLLWLDRQMRKQHGSAFVEAGAAHQTAMLDQLVEAWHAEQREPDWGLREIASYGRFRNYRVEDPPDSAPGVRFFRWVFSLTSDAFYTSPIGFQDLGYKGNTGMSEYTVPQEAIDYVMKRSPFTK